MTIYPTSHTAANGHAEKLAGGVEAHCRAFVAWRGLFTDQRRQDGFHQVKANKEQLDANYQRPEMVTRAPQHHFSHQD